MCSVKDNKTLKTGRRTRFWCSRDERKKKAKPSQKPSAKFRDYVGMKRYLCKSKLTITYRKKKAGQPYLINLPTAHQTCPLRGCLNAARGYADGRGNTPSAMASKVRAAYPEVSAAQVYNAWREHS